MWHVYYMYLILLQSHGARVWYRRPMWPVSYVYCTVGHVVSVLYSTIPVSIMKTADVVDVVYVNIVT
jgi:hypothetical protein